jgi:hypothetical protein
MRDGLDGGLDIPPPPPCDLPESPADPYDGRPDGLDPDGEAAAAP